MENPKAAEKPNDEGTQTDCSGEVVGFALVVRLQDALDNLMAKNHEQQALFQQKLIQAHQRYEDLVVAMEAHGKGVDAISRVIGASGIHTGTMSFG